MEDPEKCELHQVAIIATDEEAEDLLRVAHSPIGDECQFCPVCRSAREFVERRLAEGSGHVAPPGESANDSWAKLQTAIEHARSTIHRGA